MHGGFRCVARAEGEPPRHILHLAVVLAEVDFQGLEAFWLPAGAAAGLAQVGDGGAEGAPVALQRQVAVGVGSLRVEFPCLPQQPLAQLHRELGPVGGVDFLRQLSAQIAQLIGGQVRPQQQRQHQQGTRHRSPFPLTPSTSSFYPAALFAAGFFQRAQAAGGLEELV